MGVDIARQGDDQTVIRFRQGLDARSIPAVKFRIPDLMQVASRVLEQVEQHKPAAVFVDATGIGWGVFDRLAQLGCEAPRSISAARPIAPTAPRSMPTSGRRCGASSRTGARRAACPTTATSPPTSPASSTATTPPTPCSSSASRTCAAEDLPRPTTATRWR